jgi:DNA-binding transcriptional ArsR family regulator
MISFAPSMTEEESQQLGSLLSVLADPTRLRILLWLSQSHRHVNSLVEQLGMPQPGVSHHLSILRMAGLVTWRHEGKNRIYSLGNRVTVEGQTLTFDINGFAITITPRAEVEAQPAEAAVGS